MKIEGPTPFIFFCVRVRARMSEKPSDRGYVDYTKSLRYSEASKVCGNDGQRPALRNAIFARGLRRWESGFRKNYDGALAIGENFDMALDNFHA